MTKQQLNRGREISVGKLIPTLITTLSLCFGISSIRLAMSGKWEFAVIFIFIAAVLDMLDGGVARMLNAQTTFGGFFDSLCDFINFGFCPIFVIYLWKLHSIKFFGWGLVLLLSVCMAMRLARFNAKMFTQTPYDAIYAKFFFGTPAPASAILVLFPTICSFEVPYLIDSIWPEALILYLSCVALLTISSVPTLSLKKIKISDKMVTPLVLFFAVLVIALFLERWKTVMVLVPLYVLSIPFVTLHFARLIKRHKAAMPNLRS